MPKLKENTRERKRAKKTEGKKIRKQLIDIRINNEMSKKVKKKENKS